MVRPTAFALAFVGLLAISALLPTPQNAVGGPRAVSDRQETLNSTSSLAVGDRTAGNSGEGGIESRPPRVDSLQPSVKPGISADVGLVVQYGDEHAAAASVKGLGGRVVRQLPHVGALIVRLPLHHVQPLARAPGIRSVSFDRHMAGTLDLASGVVGAPWVHAALGFDGSGVGVAIIDSGVTRSHSDLEPNRVVHFADFVRGEPLPYDGYGHGTHVAGIIAGSGYESGGARRGIAPGAHLVVLKALDERGHGYVSDAVTAIDYAIDQRDLFNIRVINLSVAAGVYESYSTDPLALAAERAVDAGIVVVTAAGNLGRRAGGAVQHGGITAPGNAPWVLTVGAATHQGTLERSDDYVAAFSSRGPSPIDAVTKPDLVAPGTDLISLADPGSTLFAARPAARVWGTIPAEHEAYLSLSGTSMAAPVVAGAVAVMLQANPALPPDAVKAILTSTAQPLEGFDARAQGAGSLDMRAAVAVAAALVGDTGGDLGRATPP